MVAVIILTFNEAKHLARALASVQSFASEIYVVDSYSTDATLDIARAHRVEVLQHPFRNQADQFQWALETIPFRADWVLRLDADEIIEPDLARRIKDELPALSLDVTGVNLDRKHIFMGRWIRHGGRYPLTMLRLFRRGHGAIEQRWMDEHIYVHGGRVVKFSGGFADCDLNDLSYFTTKHNKYATREAIDVLNRRYGLFGEQSELNHQAVSRQAATKRWIKEKLYNRVPFPLSSLGYFLFRYIIQLGFLDGREGLVYHFLQGFWYRFLVGAKVMELDRAIATLPTSDEKLAELKRLTGLSLGEPPPRTTYPSPPETH